MIGRTFCLANLKWANQISSLTGNRANLPVRAEGYGVSALLISLQKSRLFPLKGCWLVIWSYFDQPKWLRLWFQGVDRAQRWLDILTHARSLWQVHPTRQVYWFPLGTSQADAEATCEGAVRNRSGSVGMMESITCLLSIICSSQTKDPRLCTVLLLLLLYSCYLWHVQNIFHYTF